MILMVTLVDQMLVESPQVVTTTPKNHVSKPKPFLQNFPGQFGPSLFGSFQNLAKKFKLFFTIRQIHAGSSLVAKVLTEMIQKTACILGIMPNAMKLDIANQGITRHEVGRDFTGTVWVSMPPDNDICVFRLSIIVRLRDDDRTIR